MNCRKGAKINIFAAEGPKISSIRYIVALGNALLYALLYFFDSVYAQRYLLNNELLINCKLL